MPPMTDAEFLEEMARKSNVFSTDAGVRMTPEERDRLVALGHLGDWAVLCTDCTKRYRTKIVPIDEESAP